MAEAGERRFGQGLFRFSGEYPGTLGRLAEYGTCEGAFLLPVGRREVFLLERRTAPMLQYKTATTEILKNRREPE